MAFQYFTTEKIKAIDINNIPDSFISYYHSLSVSRQEAIKELRPDLIAKIQPSETHSEETEARTNNASAIIDSWESLSVLQWKNERIDTSVVVCKIIPDNLKKCPVHRIPLKRRQLNIHLDNNRLYYVSGLFCPQCFDFFIEEKNINLVAKGLAEQHIPTWIQPLSITLSDWEKNVVPVEIDSGSPLYFIRNWADTDNYCPIHNRLLEKDIYRKAYKNRELVFNAYFCSDCNKIIMRQADALALEDRCSETGIPIEFKELKASNSFHTTKQPTRPDYLLQDGKLQDYSYAMDNDWPQLSEKDIVIISDSRDCNLEDHETEDTFAIINVQTRLATIVHVLTLLGYCRSCEKYYIDKDDFKYIAERGRALVTILDDTGDYEKVITSGTNFEEEKSTLDNVENQLSDQIKAIENLPDYVGKYATGFYDDGNLSYAKKRSEHYYQEIEKISGFIPQPYRYRVDTVKNSVARVRYFGPDDIFVNGKQIVYSFHSEEGRKLVNLFNKPEKEFGIRKLHRSFDIEKKILFGYTEETDEDAIFRKGFTDDLLKRVLKKRKQQHQLVDIMSTIQENQNTIVDTPANRNMIVQGCAGSGKTVIMLHRLSSLKYNDKNMQFDKAVILTPNSNFNVHIANLADSLQIGIISKYSIEEYYSLLLERYDPSLVYNGKIADETSENQQLVDYLYSDDFDHLFSGIYQKKCEEIYDIRSQINQISASIGRNIISVQETYMPKLVPLLSSESRRLEDINTDKEATYNRAKQNNNSYSERLKNNINQLEEKSAHLEDYIVESITKSLESIAHLIDDNKRQQRTCFQIIILFSDLRKELDKLRPFSANTLDHTFSSIKQLVSTFDTKKQLLGETLISKKEDSAENDSNFEDTDNDIIDSAEIQEIISDFQTIENQLMFFDGEIEKQINLLENDYQILERRIFVARKSERLHSLENEISQLEQRKRDLDNAVKTIQKLSFDFQDTATINSNCNERLIYLQSSQQAGLSSFSSEDTISFLESIESYVPVAKESSIRIRRIIEEIEDTKTTISELETQKEKSTLALQKAEENRLPLETRNKLIPIAKMRSQLNVKSICDAVLADAIDQSIALLDKRYGKSHSKPSGIHRYNLFISLKFAMEYYEKTVGTERFISIDEGQDLALNEYSLLHDMCQNEAIFNIYGDVHQNLKPGRGIRDWNALSYIIPNALRYELNENYRNTNQITQYCNETFHMSVLQTGVDGKPIKEIPRSHFEKELSGIHLGEQRIAIILPRSISKNRYIDMDQIPLDLRSAFGEIIGKGKISIVYVDEIKGIEFDTVYVVPHSMSTNEKYIAYTRALSELIIVVDENISEPEITTAEAETVDTVTSIPLDPFSQYETINIGKVISRKKKTNSEGI